jgi:hypothetical protein
MIRASHIERSIVTVMVGLLILPGVVWGFDYDNESSRETLRGIKRVRVMVGDIETEIERDGLTKNQIQTDAELKLRLAGLNVLSRKEASEAPGIQLIVSVAIFKFPDSSGYIYSIVVALFQNVFLERNSKESLAPTWSAGYFGVTPRLDLIRNKTKDGVDQFINAWLSVNPK